MTDETKAFLTQIAARDATSSAYARAEELALLAKVAEGLKECFELQLALDEVALAETDLTLAGSLQEYGQKLGGLGREMQTMRAQIQKVAKIRVEIDRLEERVGAPLRKEMERTAELSDT